MTFNTWEFPVFAAVVVAAYWLLPRRAKPWFLVAAGVALYGYGLPQYLALVVALATTTYVAAAAMLRARALGARRAILAAAVAVVVADLAYFKYGHFLSATVAQIARHDVLPLPAILVPLGISFFTFEFVHVLIDVYAGKIARIDPLEFAVFALFFPTLVAGPIKRYASFAPQVRHVAPLSREIAMLNLYRIGLGAVKKLVIADSLLVFTQPVLTPFADDYTRLEYWIAVAASSLKIYFDFTGYSDIAIGLAALLGFRVPENFIRPYTARNIQAYRRQWHASLSSWVRDYVFVPLGGSRRSPFLTTVNTLLAMAIIGLWHGAGWGFVLWGVYDGIGLIGHRLWSLHVASRVALLRAPGLPLRIASSLATFAFVMGGLVLFNSPTLPGAIEVYRKMLLP